MEQAERLLDIQHREDKPSSWIFNELIVWEDRNKSRITPIYGMYYHVASQVKRVADQEILLEEMRDDLVELYGRYWSPLPTVSRFLSGVGRILGLALLFVLVAVANYGLSRMVGNALAASIIIGVLAAIILVPQGARGLWVWYTKRVDAMYAVYQHSVARRISGVFSIRCPRCGRDLGKNKPDKDGFIECECGNRMKRNSSLKEQA
jgi:hypothetical protein